MKTSAVRSESNFTRARWRGLSLFFYLILAVCIGCTTSSANQKITPTSSNELILLDWEDDISTELLDQFTNTSGITVKLITHQNTQESIQRVRSGEPFDVAVLESEIIPSLSQEGRLAKLDFKKIHNSSNISPDFRDLSYDPDNNYTVPFTWGSTGLLVREDIIPVGQVIHWADLWDSRYVGKVALRMQPDELIGVALKASGHSINSESPEELEDAYQKLLELKEIIFIPEPESKQAMDHFLDSGALIMVGWSQDAIEVQRINKNVGYILPREGSLLWSDNFTVSANSSNTDAAYKFIDFMLEPEINASIVNEKYYPTANQAALAYVLPEIRINRVVYPLHEDLARSEWYLPRSSKGDKIYQEFCQKVISNMH